MTGRNEQCPCGSGRKFKKCHGTAPRPLPTQVLDGLARKRREESDHIDKYGHVRNVISADWSGYKFVGVGNHLYYSERWKTFVDFLLYYIKTKISEPWYKDQLSRDLEVRHPIALWYWRLCEFQQRHRTPNAEGLFEGVPDGPSMAFVLLAYDLYILQHHGNLQASLLERLLRDDTFQGARYELSVAATMIRAGFNLAMEDETDQSQKHPEFIATHRKLGIKVAVEAKSKHRKGVLGFPQGKVPPTVEVATPHKLAAEVCGLVEQALPKAEDLPIYVFVDLNLPPDVAWSVAPRWKDEFDVILPQIESGVDANGVVVGHRMNLLAVTNFAQHYGQPGEVTGESLVYFHNPDQRGCAFPAASLFVDEIERAFKRYGNIPKDFPSQ